MHELINLRELDALFVNNCQHKPRSMPEDVHTQDIVQDYCDLHIQSHNYYIAIKFYRLYEIQNYVLYYLIILHTVFRVLLLF